MVPWSTAASFENIAPFPYFDLGEYRFPYGTRGAFVPTVADASPYPEGMVYTARHKVSTTGQGDAHDVTTVVSQSIAAAKQRAGVATVFVVGSTAAMTTIEFEPGAIADLNRLLETLAPRAGRYEHHLRWGDDNGSSHARAALIGPSVSVPFADGELLLGTWQQIMLLEFDTRAREREIIVQIVGE